MFISCSARISQFLRFKRMRCSLISLNYVCVFWSLRIREICQFALLAVTVLHSSRASADAAHKRSGSIKRRDMAGFTDQMLEDRFSQSDDGIAQDYVAGFADLAPELSSF